MSIELDEVREFLAASAPYAQLPEDVLDRLPAQMTMKYFRRGDTIIAADDTNDFTYVIRSGAVDVLDSEGVLLDRRDAGRSFGYSTLMGDETCRYTMVAVEDTLALLVPREVFVPLAQEHPELARFFSGQSARISAAAGSLRQQSSSDVLRTRLREFV